MFAAPILKKNVLSYTFVLFYLSEGYACVIEVELSTVSFLHPPPPHLPLPHTGLVTGWRAQGPPASVMGSGDMGRGQLLPEPRAFQKEIDKSEPSQTLPGTFFVSLYILYALQRKFLL